MVKLKCQKCGNVWEYKGKNEYYGKCSQCKSDVSISKNKVEDVTHNFDNM